MEKKPSSLSTVDGGAESSFRVYYGATGAAVPFKWESQPGTPKHTLFNSASVPPLTPPPSYFSPSPSPNPKKKKNNSDTTKIAALLHTALPRLVRRNSVKSPVGSYSSSSSSSFGDASSMFYSPQPSMSESCKPRRRLEEEFEEEDGGRGGSRKGRSSSMLMCFGSVNRGCGYPVSSVKNALFSVVACRRSSHSVDYIV